MHTDHMRSTTDQQLDAGKQRSSVIRLAGLLTALIVAASVANWPEVRRFTYIAFEDRGGNLIIDHLISKGLMPGVDFHYIYGLLPLLVARAWFAVFGATPGAEFALTSCCNLFVAWGLARFAVAIRAPRSGLLVLLAATPLIVRTAYLNVTHAMEAALLVHALAEQANGRLRRALALTTVCVFVKPTMAYVYGVVLLILAVRRLLQKPAPRLAHWRRELGLSALLAVGLSLFLSAFFSARALLAIQVPLAGGNSYALMGYGFFYGRGRDFWHPPGVGLGYYLGTIAGAWLLCTTLLMLGGVLVTARFFKRGPTTERRDELVVTTLALHFAFICFFYGVSWDWIYYANILFLGMVSLIRVGRPWTLVSGCLVGLLLLVNARTVVEKVRVFRTFHPSTETANLWATDPERSEWARVLELTRGRHPAIIKMSGCAELLFPEFESTDSWYVAAPMIGLLKPDESERLRSRLQEDRDVVLVHNVRPVVEMPPFKQALSGHSLLWSGSLFDVYRPRASRAPNDPVGVGY